MPRRAPADAPLPGRLRLRDAGGEPPLRRQRQPAHPHADGKTVATPIVEIKNLNSFRSVERALHYEAERQYDKWKRGRPDDPRRPQGDARLERRRRGHQAPAQEGDGGRLPLLPRARPRPGRRRRRLDRRGSARRSASSRAARRRRFEAEYGLSPYDANVLVEQGQDVADYFDAVARATGEYKLASNWIQQDVLRTIKEKKHDARRVPRRPRRAWPT